MHENQWRLLLGAAAASCVANISWWMQPQIVNDVLTGYHVPESMAGLVVSVEFTAMAILSLAIARLGRGASYFKISAVGMLVVIFGTAATLLATSFPVLVAARLVTGAGEGAALMVSTAAVAHLTNPDRKYAQINIINVCLGAAMSFALPLISTLLGTNATAFRFLAVLVLVLTLLMVTMPRESIYSPPTQTEGVRGSTTGRVTALAMAVFLVGVSSGAMWSFYVVLGLRTGLSPADVDQAVAYSVLSALPAGVIATLVGTRFGRLPPMLVALVIITAAIIVLSHSPAPIVFRIGTCVNVASIYFLVPYFFGFGAAEDPSGRAAAVAGGSFLFTGAAGPYFGGALMEHGGVSSIAWFMLVSNTLAAAIFYGLDRSRATRAEP